MRIERFIAARLADDAASAQDHPDPARALRQVAAMRAILADHDDDEGYCSRCWDGDSYAPASRMFPCPTIRSLAFVWSDHPDYMKEWAL